MLESGSGLSFSGLFSNLDTESIITQLMYIERAPVRLLEKKSLKLEYEKEELQTVNNSLLSLKTSIQSFKTDGLAYDNTVSSSDETVVTGSANAAATEGNYQIEVLNLAEDQIVGSYDKAQTWVFGDETGGLGGSFDIRTENGTGPTFTINVGAGDSMSDIVAAINNATNGPDNFSDYGSASLITDPATGRWYAVIKTNETGTANQFKIDNGLNNAAGVIGFRQGGTIHELQAAEDAAVKIDGVTVNSFSNTMEGAITGVTLNLLDTNVGNPLELRVGLDDDDIVSRVSDFIAQFNATTDMLSEYVTTKPVQDPESTTDYKTGILFGDFDLVSTKSEIRIRTTGYVDSSLSDYQLLSQIGITSESSYGSYVSNNLEFDESKFKTALADNKDEVVALFEGWANQLDTYLEAQTKVSVIQSDAGNYYSRMLSLDDRMDEVSEDIDRWEDRLVSMEERMRNEFIAMEEALQQMQSQSTYLSSQLASLTSASSSS